jgi:hypothetical protein
MFARARLRRGLGGVSWVVLAGAIAATGGTARAQTLLGVDPYQPYTMGYNSAALPASPVDRFSSVYDSQLQSYTARSNEMGLFYDQLNGAAPYTDRFGTPRVGGTTADRQLDQQLGRAYQRNPGDAQFYADQERRNREYFQALAEKDPKKRAEKLRALQQESLRAARAMTPNARGTARRTAGQPVAAASRTPATTTTRRSQVPVGRTTVGLGRSRPFTPVTVPGASVTPGGRSTSTNGTGTGAGAGGSAATSPSARAMGLAPTPPPIMPITGRPTPANVNRARVAAPANTAPRSATNRSETPSEILDRATRSETSPATPRQPGLFDPPR